ERSAGGVWGVEVIALSQRILSGGCFAVAFGQQQISCSVPRSARRRQNLCVRQVRCSINLFRDARRPRGSSRIGSASTCHVAPSTTPRPPSWGENLQILADDRHGHEFAGEPSSGAASPRAASLQGRNSMNAWRYAAPAMAVAVL